MKNPVISKIVTQKINFMCLNANNSLKTEIMGGMGIMKRIMKSLRVLEPFSTMETYVTTRLRIQKEPEVKSSVAILIYPSKSMQMKKFS